MNQKTFQSISSDNNLFDYTHIFRAMIKDMGVTEEILNTRVEAHLRNQFPNMLDTLVSVQVARFIIRPMCASHFMEMMDALGCAVSITVTKPQVATATPAAPAPVPALVTSYPMFWDEPIDTLKLNVRTINVLKNMGDIDYVGQLVSKKPGNLRGIHSFGPLMLEQVQTALKEVRLELGTDIGNWMTPKEREAVIKWQHEPIEKLNLMEQGMLFLKKNAVKTVGQLLCLPRDDLDRLPGMRSDWVFQITELLKRKDMRPGMLKQIPFKAPNLPLGTFPPSWDKKVNDLDVPARIQQILMANNINYLGELTQMKEDDVLAFINMGTSSMHKLKRSMKAFGLVFEQNTGDWKAPAAT